MINLIHLIGKELFQLIPKFRLEKLPWVAGLGLTAPIRATASGRAWQVNEHFSPDPNEYNQEVI